MRIFLTVMILIFSLQSWTKADDIRDFEIEGMSIGDSLLDYISIKQINSNISKSDIYEGTDYQRVCIDNSGSAYDRICVTFLKNKKKTIQALQGQLRYEPLNYEICENKMLEIENELSDLFKKLEKKNWGLLELTMFKEKLPESTYHPITFDFKDQSRAQLACYNYPSMNLTVFKMVLYNPEIRNLISRDAVKK